MIVVPGRSMEMRDNEGSEEVGICPWLLTGNSSEDIVPSRTPFMLDRWSGVHVCEEGGRHLIVMWKLNFILGCRQRTRWLCPKNTDVIWFWIHVFATVAPSISLSNVSVIDYKVMKCISATWLRLKVCADELLKRRCLIHLKFNRGSSLSLQRWRINYEQCIMVGFIRIWGVGCGDRAFSAPEHLSSGTELQWGGGVVTKMLATGLRLFSIFCTWSLVRVFFQCVAIRCELVKANFIIEWKNELKCRFKIWLNVTQQRQAIICGDYWSAWGQWNLTWGLWNLSFDTRCCS